MTFNKRETKEAWQAAQSATYELTLGRVGLEYYEQRARMLEADPAQLAIHGLSTLVAVFADYAVKHAEFVEWLDGDDGRRIYPADKCPEIRPRFAQMVQDDRKAIERVRKLIEKIRAEGMPPRPTVRDA